MGLLFPRWTNFKDLLMAAAGIPKFTIKHKKLKSWISDAVLSLVRRKRKFYRMAKRSGNSKYQSKYKSLCNIVRRLTQKDRNNYLEHISSNLHIDQKPFWQWLKNLRSDHNYHSRSTLLWQSFEISCRQG